MSRAPSFGAKFKNFNIVLHFIFEAPVVTYVHGLSEVPNICRRSPLKRYCIVATFLLCPVLPHTYSREDD